MDNLFVTSLHTKLMRYINRSPQVQTVNGFKPHIWVEVDVEVVVVYVLSCLSLLVVYTRYTSTLSPYKEQKMMNEFFACFVWLFPLCTIYTITKKDRGS